MLQPLVNNIQKKKEYHLFHPKKIEMSFWNLHMFIQLQHLTH